MKGGTGDACRIISVFVAHLIRAPMCRYVRRVEESRWVLRSECYSILGSRIF